MRWAASSGFLALVLAQAGGRAGLPALALAEPRATEEYPRFLADAGSRLGPDGRPRVEVFLRLCHDGLHFEKEGAGFSSRLEMSLVAYDRHGHQVGGDSWRRDFVASSYEATLANRGCRLDSLFLSLPPGLYSVAVTLQDRPTEERSRLVFPVQVGGIVRESWHLSDLLFRAPSPAAGAPGASADSLGPVFPSRSYGEATPELGVEAEIYDTRPGSGPFPPPGLEVSYRIEDAQGSDAAHGEPRLLWAEAGTADRPARAVYFVRYPLDALSRGSYVVIVSCGGVWSSRGELSRRGSFEVASTRAFWERDYGPAVETLRYVATPQELADLRESPPAERRARWEAFWARRDPTPGTPRNEREEEYLRRVAYANDNFTTLMHRGWESDRGMVYILYGSPDDIERSQSSTSAESTEVWHYYQDGRRFVFVDDMGFGDFRLQVPLAR